jgi:hypothetical protein
MCLSQRHEAAETAIVPKQGDHIVSEDSGAAQMDGLSEFHHIMFDVEKMENGTFPIPLNNHFGLTVP